MTTVSAASSRQRADICASWPSAAALSSTSRSSFSRIISTWHSGSPKRTLYSISFGPVGGDHQAGEQHARERRAELGHAAHGRLDDLAHGPLDHVRRHHRRRRIGAHAAGVRAGVAVADALVVLRRAERQRGLAVAQAEEARLLAIEEFLDHHLGAGSAEGAAESRLDRGQRLVDRHGDGHALAGGEAVGLDDDRRALRRGYRLAPLGSSVKRP